MNKFSYTTLLMLLALHCKSGGEFSMNFDVSARDLQQKINDQNFTFYHEKHAARLDTEIVLSPDFRSERELITREFVYLLRIDESGKFTYRAIKPPPEILQAQIAAALNTLRFTGAWIGPKNFASELEIHFIVEYEAH
jgi:hypothetical protein